MIEAESRLQALHLRYQTSLPIKRASVELAWRSLCANSSDPARLESLMRLVHRLAGSAPSYGYREIGEIAASADALLDQFRQVDRSAPSTQGRRGFLDRLTPLITRLLLALEHASDASMRMHATH